MEKSEFLIAQDTRLAEKAKAIAKGENTFALQFNKDQIERNAAAEKAEARNVWVDAQIANGAN